METIAIALALSQAQERSCVWRWSEKSEKGALEKKTTSRLITRLEAVAFHVSAIISRDTVADDRNYCGSLVSHDGHLYCECFQPQLSIVSL